MRILRVSAGFLAAVATGFLFSVLFMTFYSLSNYPGFELTPSSFWSTFTLNLEGLATGSPFAGILAVAFAIAFSAAAGITRIMPPLAPIAFPLAGAAAVPALLIIVENVMIGGGVGAFFGARGLTGLALQGIAGAAGGAVFAIILKAWRR